MRSALILMLVLFGLSGASGLLYQFVWIRMLSHLLGGTSIAISSVLAAFMGGLALGSWFFGRRADRVKRPLRLYAHLELGIGILGALVILVIPLLQPVYISIARSVPAESLFVPRIAISALLLLPPTLLMGGTLPVLCRFFVRAPEKVGTGLGLVYSINTLGAVVGSFLAGFVLIHAMGFNGCTAVAVAINLAVAAWTYLIDRALGEKGAMAEPEEEPEPETPLKTEVPARGLNPQLLTAVFFASGFASLGYEIYWARALDQFLGNSTYAYCAMLTTFLIGLAAGAWIGGWLADRVGSPTRWLGWIQIAIGGSVLVTVPLIWHTLPSIAEGPYLRSLDMGWFAFVSRRFMVAFAVMAIPTFLIGTTFPFVHRIGIDNLDFLGRRVGNFYFANTAGAILGSLIAGYAVVPVLGPKGGILVTACLNVLVGLAVHVGARERTMQQIGFAAATVAGLLLIAPVLQSSGRGILSDSQQPQDEVLFEVEDPIAQTRVYRKPRGEQHMSVDGRFIGGTDYAILRKEKILAHLPLALVPKANSILNVGMGSGITLGTFGLYDEIEELTCVEIVPGVVEGARYFGESHNNILDDPRVNVVVEDGVQFLLTTEERFDIISSDSKLNPEFAGNSPLLAQNYYELCADRLTEQGVFVQWLGTHLPATEMRTVVRSFSEAFPHVALFWHNPFNVILVGSNSPIGMDVDRVSGFRDNREVLKDLRSVYIEDPYMLASLFVCSDDDVISATGPGPRNTWERPILEFTILKAMLGTTRADQEDQNLQWLFEHRNANGLPLTGNVDVERRKRFLDSGSLLLQGFGAGGGISDLSSGERFFRQGIQTNPDDRRIQQALRMIERGR